jgi:hypothetical protein
LEGDSILAGLLTGELLVLNIKNSKYDFKIIVSEWIMVQWLNAKIEEENILRAEKSLESHYWILMKL